MGPMNRIGSVHVHLRSVFSEAVFYCLGEHEMTPEEKKLRQHYDRFEGLADVPAPASSWMAAAIHGVTRLKCANLAIVSTVAVSALAAYKNLSPTTTAYAFIAIAVLGILGCIRESS